MQRWIVLDILLAMMPGHYYACIMLQHCYKNFSAWMFYHTHIFHTLNNNKIMLNALLKCIKLLIVNIAF